MSTSERMVEALLEVEGLSADPGNKEAAARYIDFLGPHEDAQMRHDMPSMSGCALTVRAAMVRAGITHRLLEQQYVLQQAVKDVLTIGREAGACEESPSIIESWVPQEGNVFHVFAPEHVFTVVKVTECPEGKGYIVESIDGGQRTLAGYQLITRVKRRIIAGHDTRLDFGTQRRVMAIIDMDRVGARFGDNR